MVECNLGGIGAAIDSHLNVGFSKRPPASPWMVAHITGERSQTTPARLYCEKGMAHSTINDPITTTWSNFAPLQCTSRYTSGVSGVWCGHTKYIKKRVDGLSQRLPETLFPFPSPSLSLSLRHILLFVPLSVSITKQQQQCISIRN